MKHVTHQMNDLNTASIRISKLKDLRSNYEPTNFDIVNESSSVYNMPILFIILLLILLYIINKCGIIKMLRVCLTKTNSEREVELALGDVVTEQINTDSQSPCNHQVEKETNMPRRSRILIRIRT